MAQWPQSDDALINEADEAQMQILMDLVQEVRRIRLEYKVEPSKKIQASVAPGSHRANLEQYRFVFARLCNVPDVAILSDGAEAPQNAASAVVSDTTLYVPLEGLLDLKVEQDRLTKERTTLQDKIVKAEQKLNNESFTAKAPPQVVQKEREALAELQASVSRIDERLKALGVS